MTQTKPPLEMWDGDPTNIEDLIDRASRDLHRNMCGHYTDGYEYDLANYLLGFYTGDAEDSGQWQVLVDSALSYEINMKMGELITVDCLLDEESDESYTTVSNMAESLLATIHNQKGEFAALKNLVVDEIVRRAKRIDYFPVGVAELDETDLSDSSDK